MLVRVARKRLISGSTARTATKQYVVTPTARGVPVHFGEVLRKYPKVILLDTIGDRAALVQMSDRDRNRLSRQHPELAIEPNSLYRKL
jgi:hypothetical protein